MQGTVSGRSVTLLLSCRWELLEGPGPLKWVGSISDEGEAVWNVRSAIVQIVHRFVKTGDERGGRGRLASFNVTSLTEFQCLLKLRSSDLSLTVGRIQVSECKQNPVS